MSPKEIEQVVDWARQGAKVLIGRDHSGRHKIKIQHGFMGLRTTRLTCEPGEVEQLKQRLYDARLA